MDPVPGVLRYFVMVRLELWSLSGEMGTLAVMKGIVIIALLRRPELKPINPSIYPLMACLHSNGFGAYVRWHDDMTCVGFEESNNRQLGINLLVFTRQSRSTVYSRAIFNIVKIKKWVAGTHKSSSLKMSAIVKKYQCQQLLRLGYLGYCGNYNMTKKRYSRLKNKWAHYSKR